MSVNISYKKQAGFFLIAIIILLAAVEGSARAYEYVGQDCNLAKAETLSNIDFFSKLQIIPKSIGTKRALQFLP